MPTRWRLFAGVELGREAAVRRHDVDRVAGLQLVADPVGEEPAADPLDRHHPVAARRARCTANNCAALPRRRSSRASVRCWPALNAKRSRSSGGISKRIELASAVSGTISATRSAWKCSAILPGRVGVGARQELHHREQMAEMLAVVAAPAAEDRALVGGRLELRFGEHRRDRRAIFVLELARIGRDAARRSAACSVSSTSNSSGTKRQHQSSPSAMRRALSSVPSPRRIVHSAASSR